MEYIDSEKQKNEKILIVEEDSVATNPLSVQKRLKLNLLIASIFIIILMLFIYPRWNYILSFAIGSTLAYLNYVWMHSSLQSILFSYERKPSAWQVSKFVSRWPAIILILIIVVKFIDISVLGALLGLFVLPLAIMMESCFQFYWVLRRGV